MLTEEKLVIYLREQLSLGDDVGRDTELFSSGVLDSVSMLKLITLLEEEGKFEVSRDEVTLENFDSVARMLRYAATKT
jgi:acyl carrier protein